MKSNRLSKMFKLTVFSKAFEKFFDCIGEFMRQAPNRALKSFLKRSEYNEDILWLLILNQAKQVALHARSSNPSIEEKNKLFELAEEMKDLKKRIKK